MFPMDLFIQKLLREIQLNVEKNNRDYFLEGNSHATDSENLLMVLHFWKCILEQSNLFQALCVFISYSVI